MLIPPKRIVFTGGGLRSLSHFGALEILDKRGLLKSVKEYVGVSAGALVGYCTMLGFTIEEMQKVVTEFDFSILQNAHPEFVLDFFTKYGIDSGEQLENFLKSLLRVRGYPDTMTFAQWSTQHPKSPRLRCYATNVNQGELKEFSLEATPTVSLVFALRASMSLPLYFIPVKDPDTGHLYVDGGLIHNFPINQFSEAEKQDTLGISFLYSKQKEQPVDDFVGFLTQVYNSGFNPRTYQAQKENKLRCIVIPSLAMSAYNFDLTTEFRQDLVELGRQAAKDYCDGYLRLLREQQPMTRRYSVH